MMIKEFQGEYRWLSNFELVDILYNGDTYPSVEHAYVSVKTTSEKIKQKCLDNSILPGTLKNLAKKEGTVHNWHDIKIDVMRELLLIKYNIEPYKSLLINTGDLYIQEGNMWNDKYWGYCLKTNKGKNKLGKLIMDIRIYISNKGLFVNI